MLNNANTAWDMGFAEMIEETPDVRPNQRTRFYKDHYLVRQKPSWEKLRARLRIKNTVPIKFASAHVL